MTEKLKLTLQTKLIDLINEYPQIEDFLIHISPVYKNLKNPILRKTVLKVASLHQVAKVGGISPSELINKIKDFLDIKEENLNENNITEKLNETFEIKEHNIKSELDIEEILNKGQTPIDIVLKELKNMKDGDILKLKSDFYPAPLIDILTKKNLKISTVEKDGKHLIYILKERK